MAELRITLPDGRTVRHTLGAEPEDIGRDSVCEIAIDDPSASRRHARFSPTAHGYLVEDLGSKNGTLVNSTPCASKLLKDGDEIQIGSTVAVYATAAFAPSGTVVLADERSTSHATHYVPKDKELSLSQKRLEMIYKLSARLITLQSQDLVLETAMDICYETLAFERGAVAIRPRAGRGLDWPVIRNLRGAGGEITISRTLLRRALEYGERAIFTDDGSGPVDPTVSMVQHGIRSAMCVPLIHGDETIGVIYGDRLSTSTAYTDEDIDFLAGIAQQVTIGVINSRLAEDQQEMIRLNHDIDLARSIQTGLFPSVLPDRPGFHVAALNDPGHHVSGDYYDVIDADDGRVWLLIADVTGEGMAAALLMANLQAAVHVTMQATNDPGILLSQWNRLICRNTDATKFITCLLALIDPATGHIELSTAGHHQPLVVRTSTDSVEELEADARYPLGVVEDAQYETTKIELGTDPFTIFLYTDGVIEAMNPDRKLFGVERLRELLQVEPDISPESLVKKLRKSLTDFAAGAAQSDDITMLAARVG